MSTDINELIKSIKNGEDSTLEFKEMLPKRNDLADEIAAFANAQGGTILIGVNDNGDIVGLARAEIDKVEKSVVAMCRDVIKPSPDFFTKKLSIDDTMILKIEIPAGDAVHETPNGYFIREGSSKGKIRTDRLSRLMQSRSQAHFVSFDKQFVPDTGMHTMNKDLYQRFFRKKDLNDDEQELLLQKGILTSKGELYGASVAGVLMCHSKPRDYLSNSFIQAVCYRGYKKDANYQLDAKDFDGPLDQQISEAFKFVERYNQVAARKDIGRSDLPQYSMRAIFEALVNAVMHRDYAKTTSKIRLFMFADRLELCVPGTLANALTIKSLPHRQATRNELLVTLLARVTIADDSISHHADRKNFLELRGEGVGIILDTSEQTSGKKPLYEMIDEELRLTIFARPSEESVNAP